MFLDYFEILRWCPLQLHFWYICYSWLSGLTIRIYVYCFIFSFVGPIHCIYYCLKLNLEHLVELLQEWLMFVSNLITLKFRKGISSWTFHPGAVHVYVEKVFGYLFVFTYDSIRKVCLRRDEVSFNIFLYLIWIYLLNFYCSLFS